MISNRRLIATIRGRAPAGATSTDVPLAARPEIVRPLSRTTFAVGLAGVTAALVLGGGGLLVQAAAEAAVAGGGGYGSGRAEVPVAAQAALDAPVVAALPATVPAVRADLAAPLPVAPPPAPTVAAVAQPAVVATPVPAAPPPAPAPGSVEAIISEVFGPAHARAAIGVARCESGLNPGAVSRGGGNWGLFQINTVHRKRVAAMGYQWEDLLDARVNSLVAHSIFVEQGWGPWGCRRAAR